MTTITFSDIAAEVGRHFDESSVNESGPPEALILMGGVATGKTTMRKDKYSHGYVLIDAAEIFHSLSGDDAFLPFPDALREPLEFVGTQVTRRALSERRNIVTEIIGAESKPLKELLKHLKALGYEVNLVLVDGDLEECIRRSEKRGDNISAYYAEPIHMKWIIDTCVELTQVRDRLEIPSSMDDVFTRLLTFPNVIITGHQGFFTQNALRNIAEVTLANITDFEQGKACQNEITADSLSM